jgi:Uri superfamily endonuclease
MTNRCYVLYNPKTQEFLTLNRGVYEYVGSVTTLAGAVMYAKEHYALEHKKDLGSKFDEFEVRTVGML